MPPIDVGTLDKIRDGSIKLCDAIDRHTSDSVVFSDGKSEKFDAIILATAFADLPRLMPEVDGVFDKHGFLLVTVGRPVRLGCTCGQKHRGDPLVSRDRH